MGLLWARVDFAKEATVMNMNIIEEVHGSNLIEPFQNDKIISFCIEFSFVSDLLFSNSGHSPRVRIL